MDDLLDVVVIGGGLAGLAASASLRKSGLSVVIIEASDQVGGRVRQEMSPIDGTPIELGAEFLHGGAASAKAACDAFGLASRRVFTAAHGDGGPDDKPAPDGGVALYYLAAEQLVLPHDSADARFVALNEALEKLPTLSVVASDRRSLACYLRDEGVPPSMLGLAAASYSNTLGVGDALEALPLRQLASLEARWTADGEGDYHLVRGGSLHELCLALAGGGDTRTSWAVACVDASGADGILRVVSEDGRQVLARTAVLAVPVSVLGAIRFEPPLPAEKVSLGTLVGNGGTSNSSDCPARRTRHLPAHRPRPSLPLSQCPRSRWCSTSPASLGEVTEEEMARHHRYCTRSSVQGRSCPSAGLRGRAAAAGLFQVLLRGATRWRWPRCHASCCSRPFCANWPQRFPVRPWKASVAPCFTAQSLTGRRSRTSGAATPHRRRRSCRTRVRSIGSLRWAAG